MTETALRAQAAAKGAELRAMFVARNMKAEAMAAVDRGIDQVVNGNWSQYDGGLNINPGLDDVRAVRNLMVGAVAAELGKITTGISVSDIGVMIAKWVRQAGI